MKLLSDPKPVNFRIVLNNTEITSLETLRENFDLELLLVDDKMQLVRGLKRIDHQKSEEIEKILNQSDKMDYQAIVGILNVIYDEKNFKDMNGYVDYLFDSGNEKSKDKFIQFISKHVEWLHRLFPIDHIPLNHTNLNRLFSSISKLGMAEETMRYMSQLYYAVGDIRQSKEINPSGWILQEDERIAIQEICNGNGSEEKVFRVLQSNRLSYIGIDFIYLCSLGYLIFYQKDNFIKKVSDAIDNNNEFVSLRNRLGGSLKKQINKKSHDFSLLFKQLGYSSPNVDDPLFNEKLFLSSFVADNRNTVLSEMTKTTDYFPAHYLQAEDGSESKTLLKRDKSLYKRWFKFIIDYHMSPQGIDGDMMNNRVREVVLVAHMFKKFQRFMDDEFCSPQSLIVEEPNKTLCQRIDQLKNNLTKEVLSDPPELSDLEKEYYFFFERVYDVAVHMGDYLRKESLDMDSPLVFTPLCEELITELEKADSTDVLKQEKAFVIFLLNIIRRARKKGITKEEECYRHNYVPMKAFFSELTHELSENDKKILNHVENIDRPYYYLDASMGTSWSLKVVGTPQYRYGIISTYFSRWLANFVYYINPK